MFQKSYKIAALVAPTLLWSAVSAARAQTQVFDFKDPKEISAVSLTLDSMMEPIVGYAKGISGAVNFDPKKPMSATGKIAVDAASVQFANEGYTATAQNFALRKDKYPQLCLTIRKVIRVRKMNTNRYEGVVRADFTCRGVTTQMTLPVTATYFAGKAEERTNGKYKGDLLVIRTHFNVSRKRYGISQGIPDSMVGDTVEVRVGVVGIHYAPGQQTPPTVAPKVSAKGKPNETWQVEVENRDDPILVGATFERNAAAPAVTFASASSVLKADRVTRDGTSLHFHLPDNPIIGEAEGTAVFSGDALTGALQSKTQRLKFHGRRKQQAASRSVASDPKRNELPAGLAALKIVLAGKFYSLRDRMKFYKTPAVSIARFEHFALKEAITLGVKDAATGEPADNATRFAVGGMGSPLISILALKLAESGKIDLERDVNSYLPGGKIRENEFTQSRKVKTLDLINLTSGLTQYKFAGYRPGAERPTLEALLEGADPDEMQPLELTEEPGKFNGAGINGALLERVLENATGRSFPDLMQDYVFAPFGMTRSGYDAPRHSEIRDGLRHRTLLDRRENVGWLSPVSRTRRDRTLDYGVRLCESLNSDSITASEQAQPDIARLPAGTLCKSQSVQFASGTDSQPEKTTSCLKIITITEAIPTGFSVTTLLTPKTVPASW